MRLTLRTLLSYLDDTLEPAEAKLMGEKVAQSEIAPELIERIAKVTRRRRLSAPAVPGEEDDASTDPNTVAEYLDNALPGEQVAEIEQAALDSDARLAEVSACHQILTLVLGEPAKVPPTARQRMYRVVKGKESIPYRKPSALNRVAGVDDPNRAEDEKAEADENPLFGIAGSRLAVFAGGCLAILLLLAIVVYMAVPSAKPAATQGYVSVALNSPEQDLQAKPPESVKNVGGKGAGKAELLPEPRTYVKNDKGPGEPEVGPKKEVEPKTDTVVIKKNPRPIVTAPDKPNPERRAIARLESKDFLLLQRPPDGEEWQRAVPSRDLFSSDTLLSLPGNRNEIKLESGVRLLLWGTMPEFHQIDLNYLLESRVKLHVPPVGIDAEFTLESGRVFITRPAAKDAAFEPARIRVRFKDELWTITLLDPETEVCLDLIGYYSETAPFSKQPGGPSPTTEVYMGVLAGRAGLKRGFREYPMLEAPTRVDWESVMQDKIEPVKIQDPRLLEWWNKMIKDDPAARELQAAVLHYAKRFSKPDEAKIDVAFYSAMQDPMEQAGRRVFALRCLQALDAYEYLPSALADDVQLIRRVAIRCIQHWTALSPERDLLIYRLLIDRKGYTDAQAQYVMQLLHPIPAIEYAKPATVATLFDALSHEKIAIRELAYMHLQQCDPEGDREVGFFNAAATDKHHDAQVEKWKASWKRRFGNKL